ncbi:alpha/beta hydrolase fold [Rhizobacter sp. OV335]|nr:alpha/beta hydrolase fold [Rhizobacter sp. OV335]
MVGMREQVAPMKGSITGPEARPLFDSMMLHVAAAPGVTYETATVGGFDGAWCRPVDAADASAAILYFHGGAYVIGSAQAYRNFVGQVVARTKTAAFVPEYGLAPERPFPAAVDDARAAYAGLPRAEADPLLTRDSLATTARLYLGEHSARDPLASPLHGNLADLPPVLIHVGEDEILLDDSRRYADRVHGQGGWCEVHVWEGMVHVFQSYLELLRAGKESLKAISEFLEHQLHTKQKVST